MTLQELRAKFEQARKDGDKKLAKTLGVLVSEAENGAKNKEVYTQVDLEKLITKFKKGAESMLSLAKDREDLKEEALYEISVYESMLPKQMGEQEIVREIGIFLEGNTGASIGDVMKHFAKNFNGLYDGKKVSGLAREILKG